MLLQGFGVEVGLDEEVVVEGRQFQFVLGGVLHCLGQLVVGGQVAVYRTRVYGAFKHDSLFISLTYTNTSSHLDQYKRLNSVLDSLGLL